MSRRESEAAGSPGLTVAARALAAVGRRFHARGWVLGTSGNFSVVLSRRPERLAITRSAVHKGTLDPGEILAIDGRGRTVSGAGRSSAETPLHLELVQRRGVGAVLHTHSVWTTILSDLYGDDGGVALEGYEMLKGLEGVATHEHREWIPILENDQDMGRLVGRVRRELGRHPAAHAFLLRRHGLYTWGRTLEEAERHVEILEFLFEAAGRRLSWPS